jgi:cytochrome P450
MTSTEKSVASHRDRPVSRAYPVRGDVPAHVPPDLVYPYDVFEPGPAGADIFEELYKLKDRAPPIFWTPYNGGHWYTPDGTLARQVLADNIHFSSQMLMLPAENNPPKGDGFTPIHLDPPEHGMYRRLLQMALSRKTVVDMLPHMRSFTVGLIERLKPEGHCEFIADVAYALPTQVFMYLVDLPESYRDGLTWRVAALHDVASDKAQLFAEIGELLRPFVHDRIADPGNDVLSWLAGQEIEGAPVTEERLHSITTLLLIAGLGTIADTFGCIFAHLADYPEHRAWIRANPGKMNGVVEELLRRYPVILAGTVRLCVEDVEIGGATVKADELMLATPPMMNFDDKVYPDPLAVDFERTITSNGSFGHGPHRCAGAALTRSLLAILIEEWLERIPEFRVSLEASMPPEPAVNVCYERLVLEWPAA